MTHRPPGDSGGNPQQPWESPGSYQPPQQPQQGGDGPYQQYGNPLQAGGYQQQGYNHAPGPYGQQNYQQPGYQQPGYQQQGYQQQGYQQQGYPPPYGQATGGGPGRGGNGKLIAIIGGISAVVIIGLIIGAVVFFTRDSGDTTVAATSTGPTGGSTSAGFESPTESESMPTAPSDVPVLPPTSAPGGFEQAEVDVDAGDSYEIRLSGDSLVGMSWTATLLADSDTPEFLTGVTLPWSESGTFDEPANGGDVLFISGVGTGLKCEIIINGDVVTEQSGEMASCSVLWY